MSRMFDIGVSSPCPHCKDGVMIKRESKFGSFLSCSRFPYCAFSQKIEEEETDWLDDIREDINLTNEDSGLIFK